MIIRTPEYYSQFKCIAGDCKDTCCAGWQVDVDDRSFAYYKTVQGEFGDRLHSVMIEGKKGQEGQFKICNDGRCPFLNGNNLCDLYTALGEDALCDTCDQYPRFSTEFGNLRETGIALSCLTAAEIILAKRDEHLFAEREDPDESFSLNNIDGQFYLKVMKDRQKAYEIVWDRTLSIRERMKRLLAFAAGEAEGKKKSLNLSESYKKMWKIYLKQVIIKKEWPELVFMCMNTLYNDDFVGKREKFFKYYEDREYEFENIMTYFLYRYFAKGVFDKDVLTKVKMAIISTIVIMHCDIAQWKNNGGSLSFEEQVNIVHLYSREVEHSEENFENLCKQFRKNRLFSVKNLFLLI